jgi:hypothetical protein
MRTIVVKEGTDLAALAARIVRPKVDRTAPLQQLKALNPHVDFARIDAGTVLLVPDTAEFEPSASTSVAGEAFAGLAENLRAGFDIASARIRTAYERLDEERKEVSTIARSAAMKRILATDPELKAQLDQVERRNKADAALGKEAGETLQGTKKSLAAELEALARLLR